MNIMCTLRDICEHYSLPEVHVIGENKLDITAQIGVRPRSEETLVDETDFVNVQAIIARALCQALAYPFLQPSLVQLFNGLEKSPCLHIVPASMFLPLDKKILFADVIRQVQQGCPDAV